MAKREKVKDNKKLKGKGKGADGAFSGGEGEKKGGGVLFALISVFSAILVIGAVLAGFLFFIVNMNVMGVADTYRDSIENVPILSLALPKSEDELVPEDMTFEQLLEEYRNSRAENEQLTSEISDIRARNEELSKAKSEFDAQVAINNEKTAQLEAQVAAYDANKKQLDDMKYELDRIVATGDTEGFRAFFESVSPEVAQEIYAQIITEQADSEETAEFLKMFQTLDTGASAAILETLGTARIDFITDTLRGMKRDIAAQIIAELSPELAAQVTLRLSGN